MIGADDEMPEGVPDLVSEGRWICVQKWKTGFSVGRMITNMACFRCGRPPWQHWRDYQNRIACYYPLKSQDECLIPSLYSCATNQNLLGSILGIHDTPCPRQVKRRRLKETNNHTNEDVLMNYGHRCANFTPMAMQKMCDKLDDERKEIRTWATNEIKKRMLKTAIMCGMEFGRDKMKVRQFNDIYTSWTDDCSDANARKMYMVLYGNFEGKHAHWSKNMEREYMENMERHYIVENDEGENKRIGCYEKQITGAKTTQVKLLNRTDAKEERGKSIQMSNPGKKAGEKSTRRKAGDFFVKDLRTVRKAMPW
jgi:hypothetical protein